MEGGVKVAAASKEGNIFARKTQRNTYLPPCLQQSLLYGVDEPDRETWIKILTTYLKENGHTLESVLQIVPAYDGVNSPPLDGEDMAKLVKKAYSEKEIILCRELWKVQCLQDECVPKKCHRKAPRHYFDGKVVNAKYVAEEILSEMRFATVSETGKNARNRKMYVYKDGVYRSNGESVLLDEIQKRLHASWRSNKSYEIMKYIKDKTSVSLSAFDADPRLINLENGLYNREKGELIPHNPNYLSRRRVPIVYDELAECPVTDEFQHSVLGSEDIIFAVRQFIGYCLYPTMPIQRAFLLVGEPNSGKGTMLRQIRAFVGEENTCSIPLHLLETSRFATPTLTEKMVNIYGDLAPTELPSVETFRMMIGEDLVRGEYKGAEDFYFQNGCKFIYGANTTPKVKDQSDAYYRRWYIIPFGRRIDDCKIDINLTTKLTTREELSGLLNLALPALDQLLEDQHFYKQPSLDESRTMYEKASDPIQWFIDDMIEKCIGDKLAKDDVYESFLQYCALYRLQTYGKNTFDRLFGEKTGAELVRKEDFGREPGTLKRIRKPAWLNIRLAQIEKEDDEEVVDLR